MRQPKASGVFITFEGGEGCGKSTQLAALAKRLGAKGQAPLITREPGGTAIGEIVRDLLKHNPAGKNMCAEAELLLFAASRAQLVREVLQPALDDGQWVLCDRFLDSTTVYQGVARALAPEAVEAVNRFAIGQRVPDLTILVDIPAATGLERARARTDGKLDRMESEALAFYENVRRGYLTLAEAEPERFFVVDGTSSIKTLEGQIWDEISRRFT